MKNYTDLYRTGIELAAKYFGATWGLITYFASIFDSLAIFIGLESNPYRLIYSIKGLNEGLHNIFTEYKARTYTKIWNRTFKKLLNTVAKIHLLNYFLLIRRNIEEYTRQLSEAIKQIPSQGDDLILKKAVPNKSEEQLLSS